MSHGQNDIKKTSKVGAIIINWNGSNNTLRCIESLKLVKSCQLKILIIDNGSRKSEANKLRIIKNAKICFNNTNLGYAKGVNQGIKYFMSCKEKVDYVLFLNNDIVGEGDFLRPLLETMQSNSQIGIICPAIYFDDDRSKLWFSGGKIDTKKGVISNDFSNNGKLPYEDDWSTGCCALIRTEIFKEVGLINESFGMYVEDVDFSLRARMAGYKSYLDPQAIIYHAVSSSSGGKFSMLKRYFISKNTMYVILTYPKYFPDFRKKNIIQQFKICFSYPKFEVPNALFNTATGLINGVYLRMHLRSPVQWPSI